jgi:hypothetical protein
VSNLEEKTNTWLGLLAISAMVGLFSQQAALKLKDIANAVFTKPGAGEDNKPQASGAVTGATLPEIIVAGINPSQGPLAGSQEITISGSGFVDGAKVILGGKAATDVKFVSAERITARTPSSQQAGKVDVEVINPCGKSSKLANGYEYTSV